MEVLGLLDANVIGSLAQGNSASRENLPGTTNAQVDVPIGNPDSVLSAILFYTLIFVVPAFLIFPITAVVGLVIKNRTAVRIGGIGAAVGLMLAIAIGVAAALF